MAHTGYGSGFSLGFDMSHCLDYSSYEVWVGLRPALFRSSARELRVGGSA